jgi:hypothetical protein
VLEVYEAVLVRDKIDEERPQFKQLIDLLALVGMFNQDSVASILGFKFRFYQRPEVGGKLPRPILLM